MQFKAKDVVLSLQHAIAMFGATILIPILMGLPPSLGLFSAGVGTLIYHFITKNSIPIFLGSSAAYLATFISLKNSINLGAAVGSFIGAGLVYLLFGLIISYIGYKKITKLLPNTVAGAVIIVIGITLVPIALMLASSNYLLAGISAIFMILYCSIENKVFRTAPVLLAISSGYIIALFMGIIDFKPVLEAPWFTLPGFVKPEFNFSAIQVMAIIGIVSMLEHLGDLTTNGMIVGKNHFEKPGLHKSLLGQGLALIVAGCIGGTPTTTYGENNGVLALTKNYNPKNVRMAAFIAIILSLFGKFGALLGTIPLPVIGGVSFILFGMLMMSGVTAIQQTKVNLMEFRHAAVIFLPIFIGVASVLPDNPLKIVVGQHLTLAGISLAAVVGIGLNLFFNIIERFNRKEKYK